MLRKATSVVDVIKKFWGEISPKKGKIGIS